MSAISLTFGDVAENHKGMQKIGNLSDNGYSLNELLVARQWFESRGCVCDITNLHSCLGNTVAPENHAWILVVKGAVNVMSFGQSPTSEARQWGANPPPAVPSFASAPHTGDLRSPDQSKTDLTLGCSASGESDRSKTDLTSGLLYNPADLLLREQAGLVKDTKAFMYGRVVNKHARHNLCFAEEHQEPNYAAGMGTVYAFSEVPYLKQIREQLHQIIPNVTGQMLQAEGNYYYNIHKCGIGYHGDAERKKVVAVRLGTSIPLCFRWYHRHNQVGPTIVVDTLEHGDLYILSEKATGFDWKSSSKYTLRHAAGCKQFVG